MHSLYDNLWHMSHSNLLAITNSVKSHLLCLNFKCFVIQFECVWYVVLHTKRDGHALNNTYQLWNIHFEQIKHSIPNQFSINNLILSISTHSINNALNICLFVLSGDCSMCLIHSCSRLPVALLTQSQYVPFTVFCIRILRISCHCAVA